VDSGKGGGEGSTATGKGCPHERIHSIKSSTILPSIVSLTLPQSCLTSPLNHPQTPYVRTYGCTCVQPAVPRSTIRPASDWRSQDQNCPRIGSAELIAPDCEKSTGTSMARWNRQLLPHLLSHRGPGRLFTVSSSELSRPDSEATFASSHRELHS
jgi:hypothetical protein